MGFNPFWEIREEEKMKCHKCNMEMMYTKDIEFNGYSIDSWKCGCGEIYFNPEQAQKVLLLNKLKKEEFKVKLGKIRSNLILRLPKDVESALNLRKGEKVILKVQDHGLKVSII